MFFTEGGGGRPGDTDGVGVAYLDCLAFHYFARLSGLVPLVGIVSGYCFAGNAALLGCCDVIIATEGSNIGMGGPAMIEGGGLGDYDATEIGPIERAGVRTAWSTWRSRTKPRRSRSPSATCRTSSVRSSNGRAPTKPRCATSCRRTVCAPMTCAVIDVLGDVDSVLELRAAGAKA